MSNISDKIFEKIKNEKIEPKPRWQFLLKNYTMWTLGVLSLIIGSLAFSVIIFLTNDHDWNAYALVDDGFLGTILQALPYFWIAIMIIFAGVAFYNLRHTKGNYRYNAYIIFLGSLVISMILGSVLARAGFGQTVDQVFTKRMPIYERIVKHKVEMWQAPHRGLLGGRIIQVEVDGHQFNLKDVKKDIWQVMAMEANLRGPVIIEMGEQVKMVGKVIDFKNRIFEAREIMPCGQPGVKSQKIFFVK